MESAQTISHREPVEPNAVRRKQASTPKFRNRAGVLLCLVIGLTHCMSAQTADDAASAPLRHPGWNYGGQISGGFTVVQVASPHFLTANRNISSLALSFRAGRVLTYEHGSGWTRGTFEWGLTVIPVQIFWVLGYHYAGGFEAFGTRWNFTHDQRVVPFVGVAGGMLFSPRNFPPGDTYQANFTIACDLGVHLFVRRKQSLDVSGRVYHLSNAFLGRLNPGIPVGLQFTLGYTWY